MPSKCAGATKLLLKIIALSFGMSANVWGSDASVAPKTIKSMTNGELIQSLSNDPKRAFAREVRDRMRKAAYDPDSEISKTIFQAWQDDKNQDIKIVCSVFLGEMKHGKTNDIIIDRILNGKTVEERIEAVLMLYSFKNEKSALALEKAIRQEADNSRAQLRAFEEKRSTSPLKFDIEGDRFGYHVIGALSNMGELSFPVLQRLFEDKAIFNIHKDEIISSLGATGNPTVIEGLVGIWNGPRSSARATAIYALGRIGERYSGERERVKIVLLEAVKDENPQIRVAAVEALGRIRAKDAISVLQSLAKADPYNRGMDVFHGGDKTATSVVVYPVRVGAAAALKMIEQENK